MLEDRREAPVGPHSTVWLVSLKTGLGGRKGQMWLDGRELVFRPASDRYGDMRLRLEHIRRVKAARFTPVMDMRLSAPDQPSRIGFYFVKPPSLDPVEKPGVHLTSPRRRARRDAATSLRGANPMVREELVGWVERIKRALRQRT
jgi:hypothetical protein